MWVFFLSATASWAAVPEVAYFPAAPICGFKSNSHLQFFDASRKLCVTLDDSDTANPLSLPCPPGSGRSASDFLCLGNITTGYEIKCAGAHDYINTRPFYANSDYQCIRTIVYTPRGVRCPEGFVIRKVVDRYGTGPSRRPLICVSIVVRDAEVVPIDPIVAASCEYVTEIPLAREPPVLAQMPDLQLEFAEDGLPLITEEEILLWESETIPVHHDGVGPADLRHPCARISFDRILRCNRRAKLISNAQGSWSCESKVFAPARVRPTGCKKKFWWSNDLNACVSIAAYSPPRTCPSFDSKPHYRHSGAARRMRTATRFGGTPSSPQRCFVESAFPDNPHCPPGYWLQLYHRQDGPLCIRESVLAPQWSCRSVSGTAALLQEGEFLGNPVCQVAVDPVAFVPGPPNLSKRQQKNTKAILHKTAVTPIDLVAGYEETAKFSVGAEFSLAAQTAWNEAVDAAIRVLGPDD